MSRLAHFSPRRSFAGKVLAALVGSLAVVLGLAFAAVRAETAAQVAEAATRAAAVADTTFRSIEAVQRATLAEVAGRVAGGRRGVASLEAAMESGEVEPLVADMDYDLELSQLSPDQVLVVLTDPDGATLVARAGGRVLAGDDPADVRSLVDRMYAEGLPDVRAYRVVEGRLYNLYAAFLELDGRAIGTFSLGLPMGDAEARTLGGVAGAEVCFLADGRCVAATDGAEGALLDRMIEPSEADRTGRIEGVGGGRWTFSSNPLDPTDATIGRRVMAVPLDPVLEPFDRISRTLVLAGLLALGLSAVLGMVFARGLTRPVRALVAATDRVARGDYEGEVTVSSRDEIGTLAQAFNHMTHGLRLKERYRGVLNKVVSPEVAEELMRGEVELGGENREVSVLFADIRGFTSLTEGMEPQTVIRLLNECMGILSRVVDEEGGVVDKYVGDQIMAVFGAPVRSPDHAARAVRAAIRMRSEMARLNDRRRSRGEPAVEIGVGIGSGLAVAGNMGSPERLNYTVLGETVNLASRLCGAADVDQILVNGAAARAAGVDIVSLGGRALKGFSGDVEVFEVTEGPARGAGAAPGVGLALALLCLCAGSATAQSSEGLWWTSPSGVYQAGISGRLDFEAYAPRGGRAGLLTDADPFASGRLRLFLDAFAGERVYGAAELRVDGGETPTSGELDARVEQAFLRIRAGATPIQLQVGKFASPFGSYAQRHHTIADPFIRPPLPYDAHTVVSWNVAPPSAAGFLTWRDRPGEFRASGAPPIWNVPYQWGAMVTAARGALDVRGAWMNSLPSSLPAAWGWRGGERADGAWVLGAGWTVSPELRLGGSWTRGPYLGTLTQGALPPGAHRADFPQELWGIEASFSRGPVVVRGEFFHDDWRVPNVANVATDRSGYVEAQADLTPGVWVAVRLGGIQYGAIASGSGPSRAWDYDAGRAQLAAGYRIARAVELKAEVMRTGSRSPVEDAADLLALQLWWAF